MTARQYSLLTLIKRNALETHERCQRILDGKTELSSNDVHALRVASKQLRASWQLLKPLLKTTHAEEGNRQLARGAATLRVPRDLKVMSTTLSTLAKQASGKDAQKTLSEGHRILFSELNTSTTRGEVTEPLVNAFHQDQLRWQSLEIRLPDSRLLRKGYVRLYDKAIKLANAAQTSGDVTLWHRNRKWVKYLGYSLSRLPSSRTLPFDHADIVAFGKKLGQLHDIHCLIEYASEHRKLFSGNEDAAYLVHQLRVEESHLQWRCEKTARKLLTLSAKKFEQALLDD